MSSSQSDIAEYCKYHIMSIKIIPFFSPITPEWIRRDTLDRITQDGVEIVTSETKIDSMESICIFIGTGGTENDVVRFIEANDLKTPFNILSYEQRNSLPAAMEIRTYLGRRGIPARIVHQSLDNLHDLLGRWVKYSSIISHVASSRLGLVGHPSSWLIASEVNRREVSKQWGLEIVDIPIQALVKELPVFCGDDFKKQMNDFSTHATLQSVSETDVTNAGVVTQRLSEIVDELKLDAVTVQCFTLLQETGISGCVALSHLNDIGELVAGCEGDVPAAFTMLLAKILTGLSSFMANVTDVDLELNTAVFAHCTVPLSLVERYEITNHFETGRSVGIRGNLPLTEVTVFKVFGHDLCEYWVSGGTIIDNIANEKGCRTQVRVAMDEPVDYFINDSLANHHIIIPGDHVQEIEEFFEFFRSR